MTTNELTTYLYKVYCLEKQKYDVAYAFNRIQSEINTAQNIIEENINVKYRKRENRYSSFNTDMIFWMPYMVGWIGFLIDIFSEKAIGLEGLFNKGVSIIFSFIWPVILALMIKDEGIKSWLSTWNFKLIVLFSMICLVVLLVIGMKECKINKKQDEQIRMENEKIKLNSQQAILSNQNYIDNVLIPERGKLKTIYKQTDALLNKLYSINVIGEKYRNLVAVSSFYEYLKYERCSSLTGVNGAYNKFEDELYKRQIISKLEEIIKKLDEIKDNQFMLYNAIKESQQQTRQLFDDLHCQMNQCSRNQRAINESLDRLDYNSRCIKMNLDIESYWRNLRY